MKRIVYLVMLLSAVLSALVLAQDNRILSKGYALFSKDGEFTPLNLPATPWATMTC